MPCKTIRGLKSSSRQQPAQVIAEASKRYSEVVARIGIFPLGLLVYSAEQRGAVSNPM
jgi:hypothetical protein